MAETPSQELIERCADLERRLERALLDVRFLNGQVNTVAHNAKLWRELCEEAEAKLAQVIDLSTVTRVGLSWPARTMRDHDNPTYREWWDIKPQFLLQDDGRTLKIFLDEADA